MYTDNILLRRPWSWKRIFLVAIVTFVVFVTFYVSFVNTSHYEAIYKNAGDGASHLQSKLKLEIANSTIEVETEILSNGKLKSVITVIGDHNVTESASNRVANHFIDVLTNPMYGIAIEEVASVPDQPTAAVLLSTEADAVDESPRVEDESILLPTTLERLREKLRCLDRSFERTITQRGEYWVYNNYIPADHGPLSCHQDVTFATHSDFTFLDNLVPVLERWRGPLSVAMHTPGDDLAPTIDTMRYMRDCSAGAALVRQWVSFHLFFHKDHMPQQVPRIEDILNTQYNCSLPEPFAVNVSTMYKVQKDMLHPVNVGRNAAKDATLTHFLFMSDIELYPSPKLGAKFLNMVARDPPAFNSTNPRVFPIVLFEVEGNQKVPMNKTSLLQMIKDKKAIPFHKYMCPACHNVPMFKEWLDQDDTGQMDVFTVGKRTGPFAKWEPIFIGTHSEPMYEERLSWEGKSDKMTQSYVMCVKDYDYMILNDAFLVHRPGIKTYHADRKREGVVGKTNSLIRNVIGKELKTMFGEREGCVV